MTGPATVNGLGVAGLGQSRFGTRLLGRPLNLGPAAAVGWHTGYRAGCLVGCRRLV